MVDMTGSMTAEPPRTPEDLERDDALEEQSKHSGRMIGAGVCMAISAALAGAGYQFGQWWLLGFALVVLTLLTGLYNDTRGRWASARERHGRVSRAGTIIMTGGELGRRGG